MPITRQNKRRAGSTALTDYCEQLRYRRLHHARFTAERLARVSAEGAATQKSQFIAMMSHELRTPLNSIIGFSDLLIDPNRQAGPAEIADYAQHINNAGRHLIGLVNAILEMSKIQSGAVGIDIEPSDLKQILRGRQDAFAAIAKAKNIAFAIELADDGPMAMVDPVRARQCIENIVSNALKFTAPGGSVTIACRDDGDDVTITVADTGAGMTPEEISRALTPFGQVSTGFDRGSEGTGLGLCIAKELTELQNGRFRIESERGVGTTVVLAFPAARTGGSTQPGTGRSFQDQHP